MIAKQDKNYSYQRKPEAVITSHQALILALFVRANLSLLVC